MSKTTKKWVLENYSKQEILKQAPKTTIRRDTYELDDGVTLADIISYFGISPNEIRIESGGSWESVEYFAVHEYEDNLSEDERLVIGTNIIQRFVDEKERKQKALERKQKELEKLKKELENE